MLLNDNTLYDFALQWVTAYGILTLQKEPNFTKTYYICIWCKILTGENIDEFDKFPAIRRYFPITADEFVAIQLHPK